jgi:hypothetical protein
LEFIKKNFFSLSLIFCGICNSNAQRGPVSSGAELSGSQGFVSYSIGQIDYITSTGTDGTVTTEGLQQPYEISVTDQATTDLDIAVYQNLTSDFVVLSILGGSFETLYYTIYDVQGKLIKKNKIMENKTDISLNELANAIYFIKVFNNEDKGIKTFKVIKNR